ncbi:hypothetical protein CMEL01_04513 [Colletotrichum melonis]|uniref:Uncharacterized protein n=1 Tax=Colletotrichum melonis TaxID=1209925 RepID=A0AAI9XPY2_9PEZI|nr:hypothetical protein CMEL01_04513 [Colletotrichum melonis]
MDDSKVDIGDDGAIAAETLHSMLATDLPGPESFEEYSKLPPFPPGSSAPKCKGMAGALLRIIKGVPPCVWIINQHDDDITAVVSKYRPNRLLTGADFNVSVTGGGGVGFTSATYTGPATTKTIAPEHKNKHASVAVFPLWTRKDGFGVISIFVGADKVLYIENDRIPAGATAYFKNTPNLIIVNHEKQASDH